MKSLILSTAVLLGGVAVGDTADAAEPAVYRPDVNQSDVQTVGWRGDIRQAERQWNRAQRNFRNDYRDYRNDYRDYRRDTHRYNYGRSYGYYPSYGYGYRRGYGYGNGGLRVGNVGIYW